MTRPPWSARTVQRAPPCVLRRRRGWAGAARPLPPGRPQGAHHAAGRAVRSPCPQCGRHAHAGAGVGGGLGGAGPEAAAAMPIFVGRGHSLPCRALAACPARLPPGQLAAAVSHPSGMAHAPPRDSCPTGPAGSAPARREGRAAGPGLGVPTPPLWPPCPQGSSGAQVQARQRGVGGPRPAVAVGLRGGLVPGPWAEWPGSGRWGPPLTRPRGHAGDELERIRPGLYRNVARQLNVSPHSETAVTSAFLAVAAQIVSAGGPARAPPGACACTPRL